MIKLDSCLRRNEGKGRNEEKAGMRGKTRCRQDVCVPRKKKGDYYVVRDY